MHERNTCTYTTQVIKVWFDEELVRLQESVTDLQKLPRGCNVSQPSVPFLFDAHNETEKDMTASFVPVVDG